MTRLPRSHAWLPTVLLVFALALAACAPAAPGSPTTAPAGSAGQTPVPVAGPAKPGGSTPAAAQPGKKLNLPVGVDADGNFYRGDPKAPVKFVEYSDFQCPYCARHATQTAPLLDEAYVATGKIVHIFRNFPLSGHPNALPAAKTAYCAGQQDPKFFWTLHDWLFANQSAWANAQDPAAQLRKQAVALGVDGTKYDACLSNPATEARINRDLQDGSKMGVGGTPAFFINNWFISGAYPFDEFKKTIEKALAGQNPPPTPTPLPSGVQFFDADPARPGLTYDGSPTLGATKAKVVMIMFEDLKSPDSAKHVASAEPALKSRYIDTEQMRLVFKFFPTTAPRAAVAALCAAKQGKFWEFRGLLYQKQSEWKEGDDAAMLAYARNLGLNERPFDECLKDEKSQAEVDYAYEFGQQEIGVPSAPSYLILKIGASGQPEDGKGFPGPTSLEQLDGVIQGFLKPQAAPLPRPTPISTAQLAALPVGVDANGNFYRGDLQAPVRLVDFSDFQCPFCARHVQQTEPLLYTAYMATGKVLHVFRNFPIPELGHSNAIPAAYAAYCAGQQNPKFFWAMHDWLFINQNAWANAANAAEQFRKQALAVGADAARYDACLKDAGTEAAIQKDLKDGQSLGVNGTPSFFVTMVNAQGQTAASTPLVGAQAYEQFSQAIETLLNPPATTPTK